MSEIAHRNQIAATQGTIFHRAMAYDLLLRVVWGRSERRYREAVVDLARVTAGESVLDVGCGTGTQAIALKHRVGEAGKVNGIDASPEMAARARSKAAKAGVDIDFQVMTAERLLFADAALDAVLSTTVIHCLPHDVRRRAIVEMHRVLKSKGRLLLIDFGGPAETRRSLVARMRLHRQFDLREIVPFVADAGFTEIETGPVGFSDLQFVRATA